MTTVNNRVTGTIPATVRPASTAPAAATVAPKTAVNGVSTFQAATVQAANAPALPAATQTALTLTGAPAPAISVAGAQQPLATDPAAPPPPNPFASWITSTYETLLRRPPTAQEMTNATNWIAQELNSGKNIFQAGAEIVFFVKLTPEYKADHPMLNWLNGLYSTDLGRYPTDQEVDQAEDLMKTFAAQGKNLFQCAQGLDFCIHLTPEYQQYHAANPFAQFVSDTYNKALGRAPTPAEMAAFNSAAAQQGRSGTNWMQICANITNEVMSSPEFHTDHPFASWLQNEYQSTLGRQPSLDEIISGEALIGKFLSEGKNIFQAAQGFDFCLKLSPEYQQKHPPAPVASNAAALAEQYLGQSEYTLEADGVTQAGVDVSESCANFVSSMLAKSGAINFHTNLVVDLSNQLQAQGWRVVPLADAQPGDVWICNSSSEQHTELVASNSGGRVTLIGSNNIMSDGSQAISYDSGSPGQEGSYILAPP